MFAARPNRIRDRKLTPSEFNGTDKCMPLNFRTLYNKAEVLERMLAA